MPFFRFTLRDLVLEQGSTSWMFGFEAANDIRIDGVPGNQVREDYEIDRMLVQYRGGLGNGWDLTVDGQILHRGHGGMLDAFLDAYHRAILTMPHDRDGQPFGRSYVEIPGHATYGAATSIGDISVTGTKTIDPRLFASVAVKLPTGKASDLLGSGAIDAGASLNWVVPISPRKKLILQGGLVYQGRGSELPEARRWIGQEALSFIYRWSNRESLVFQFQNENSALVTGVADSDGRHSITTYAYERRLDEKRSLQVFISEDGDWLNLGSLQIAGVGPDFTVGMRYIFRF